jgi:dUTP pyrophosphatase
MIVVERLFPEAQFPKRATAQSAGYDLFAYVRGRTVDCSDGSRTWTIALSENEPLVLDPGVMALVPLGFRARLPNGYEAQIRPRSGISFRKGLQLPNSPGTVDSDFPDEWRVIVRNGSSVPLAITHGDRIAQMVLHRYETLDFSEGEVLATTERAGGFGSTGV